MEASTERRLFDALDAMKEVRLAFLFGSQAGRGGGSLSDVELDLAIVHATLCQDLGDIDAFMAACAKYLEG